MIYKIILPSLPQSSGRENNGSILVWVGIGGGERGRGEKEKRKLHRWLWIGTFKQAMLAKQG